MPAGQVGNRVEVTWKLMILGLQGAEKMRGRVLKRTSSGAVKAYPRVEPRAFTAKFLITWMPIRNWLLGQE